MPEESRPALSQDVRRKLLTYQENEITEHHIYNKLAEAVDSPENSRILRDIAEDELRHYHDGREYTKEVMVREEWRLWTY